MQLEEATGSGKHPENRDEQLKMSTTKHKALVTFEKNEHALACRRKFHR